MNTAIKISYDQMPGLEDFKGFMRNRAKDLKAGQFQPKEKVGSRPRVHTTTTEKPKTAKKCMKCEKPGHSLSQCEGFAKLNTYDRWALVKKMSSCQNHLDT